MADEQFRERLKDEPPKKGVADRSFSRVATSFPIRFIPVSKDEVERLHKTYLAQPTRERREHTGLGDTPVHQAAPGAANAALMDRLDRIEKKLDQLLQAQGLSVEKPQEANYETGECIDLSGSGLLFNSQWAMGKGWFLKLLIEVPDSPPVSVVALGRVVRVVQLPDSPLYETACHFEAINEEDREELIAYIFKRHREVAQLRREQE